MEIPPEGRDHESERERLCLLQSHWGCRVVKKKTKNRQSDSRSRNSVTPSIRSTDSSVPFHILWLDSFQEIFSESVRTLVNPKDCEVPWKKKTKKKTGCRQKHSTSLAGWETYMGREVLWAECSCDFCFFRLLLPFFLREFKCLKSKHFTSYRCSGPGRPDLPCCRRPDVIH